MYVFAEDVAMVFDLLSPNIAKRNVHLYLEFSELQFVFVS